MMIIGVRGAHSTGKTTLLNALSLELAKKGSVAILREAARECPFPLNKDGDEEAQAWIFAKQMSMMSEAEGFDYLLCDRTYLDQVAYIIWLLEHDRVSDEFATRYVNLALVLDEVYDVALYVPIEWDGVADDGVRDIDPAYQRDIDDHIRALMDVSSRPTRTVHGSIEERVYGALTAIERAEA
jgi:nicotinamide riboside kinase